MERIIVKRMSKWLEYNAILSPKQAGFCKGRCIGDQCLRLSQVVMDGFQSKQRLRSAAAFFDIWRGKRRLSVPSCGEEESAEHLWLRCPAFQSAQYHCQLWFAFGELRSLPQASLALRKIILRRLEWHNNNNHTNPTSITQTQSQLHQTHIQDNDSPFSKPFRTSPHCFYSSLDLLLSTCHN